MGRFERKIKRYILRKIGNLILWILSAPFMLLKWLFSSLKSSKHINTGGYVVLTDINELEHRHIAKKRLGRNLQKNEVIHHINGVKSDNSVNNLCLMDREKHEHFHAWIKWKKEKSGSYPTIGKQKQVLEKEYGGSLLEQVKPLQANSSNEKYRIPDFQPADPVLQDKLLEELKVIREMLAGENGVPPYMIFPNKTLIQMSKRMPTSEPELLKISGIGPVKMRRYGSYFLHEIKKYKKIKEEESA